MHGKSADLLAFPLHRRAGCVRRTAAELSGLHGQAASDYWRDTARELLAELIGQGRHMEQAKDEVRRYFEAVQAEFRRSRTSKAVPA